MKFVVITFTLLHCSLFASNDYEALISGNHQFSKTELIKWKSRENTATLPESADHKSILHAQKYLAANPNLPEAHLFYASSFFLSKKFELANHVYEKLNFIEVRSGKKLKQNWREHYCVSLSYLALKKYKTKPIIAKSYIEKINKIDPKFFTHNKDFAVLESLVNKRTPPKSN